jgi:DNA modification methylase
MIERYPVQHAFALEFTKTLFDASIDCVITSPAYWQLRDYGYPEQWGLEPTFQLYLEHLWSLMDELFRVVKDTGTVFINLGDTYSSNSGGMGKSDRDRKSGGQPKFTNDANSTLDFQQNKITGIKEKCLLLIPHRFAIGCIERGWILRNDIIWAKRNGMPESVTDRFSKKHEFIFFFVKQQKYYFDLDGIKDQTISKDNSVRNKDITKLNNTPGRSWMAGLKENNYDTKNPGDVSDFWDVPTQPSSEKHYATFNSELIDKPILAGSPEGGIIFDPFAGTGTTLVRALQLGRKAIGCDGNKDYVELANKRISDYLSQYKLEI